MEDNDVPCVLIVDDEVVSNRMIRSILERSGYRTICAFDIAGALKALSGQRPDIMLLDVNLPDGSGFDLCKKLKKDGGAPQLPVLFISASYDIETKLKGFEAGGVDYITKPVAGAEVLARVGTHLRLKQAYEALAKSQATHIQKLALAQQTLMPLPQTLPSAQFYVFLDEILKAGGDFYDVIRVGNPVTDYIVADASGHDLAATFWTATLKTLFNEYINPANSQLDVLGSINAALRHVLPAGVFFTIIYARLNRQSGILSIMNAGNPPAIVIPADGGDPRIIEQNGDIVGVFSDASWGHVNLPVRPGDRFLLYSDGLIETGNRRPTGMAQLTAACGRNRTTAALGPFVTAVVKETISKAVPQDDVLCMGVEV
jgi:sigma-B regulation protein RsbU (phosphoserine phosphatase)